MKPCGLSRTPHYGNLCSSLAMDNIPQGESSFSIDVQNLLNDIYIVVAKMDNEHQIVTKLLINYLSYYITF